MREEVDIRFAVAEEIPAIVSLMRAGFPYIIDKIIYGCSGVDNFIEENLTDPTYVYIVVIYRNKVAGAIEYRITDDAIILNYIALGEALKGKGLANMILAESCKILPHRNKIILDVFSSNTVAVNWYEKIGFRTIGHAVWNEIYLSPETTTNVDFKIINTDINDRKYRKYGFSVFQFYNDTKMYSVGIMGSKWLRITDSEILNQMDPLVFIQRTFPNRNIFAITDKEFKCGNKDIALQYIIDSQKMER